MAKILLAPPSAVTVEQLYQCCAEPQGPTGALH